MYVADNYNLQDKKLMQLVGKLQLKSFVSFDHGPPLKDPLLDSMLNCLLLHTNNCGPICYSDSSSYLYIYVCWQMIPNFVFSFTDRSFIYKSKL